MLKTVDVKRPLLLAPWSKGPSIHIVETKKKKKKRSELLFDSYVIIKEQLLFHVQFQK